MMKWACSPAYCFVRTAAASCTSRGIRRTNGGRTAISAAATRSARSNFIWQVGHLLVSQNFHTLTAVTGVNEKVGRLVPPIPKYNRIFNGMGTLHRSIEKDLIPVAELREQTEIVHQICIENLETLNDDVLAECLQPLPFKHPVAETKYEALSWSFKHEMWHSAEMEAIKRDLGYPIVWMK